MVTMLSMTLIAVGAAVAAWLRPTPRDNGQSVPPKPTFSGQQMADAKANVCQAYNIVKNAVATNTNRPNPVEGDEIGAIAVGTNGRLALYSGADYLLDRLLAEPATPVDLTQNVRSLATLYKDITIWALNNEPNPALDSIRHAIDDHITSIDQLCK